MVDRGLLHALDEMARYGETQANPPPAETIRRIGNNRRRRRNVAGIAGALAMVLITGWALVSGAQLLTLQPPQPAETPAPLGQPMTIGNLPVSFDMEWGYPEDWVPTSTGDGAGAESPSRCITDLDSLGMTTVFHRKYAFSTGNRPTTAATTVGFEFANQDGARSAYQELSRQVAECEQTLQEQGYRNANILETVPADVESGEAAASVIQSEDLADPEADFGVYEQVGLGRIGPRVLLISMIEPSTEFHWSTTEGDITGFDLWPMLRTLPKAIQRLSGTPAVAPPPREFTDANLLSVNEVPPHSARHVMREMRTDEGRPADAMTACQTGPPTELNPTEIRVRNFTQDFTYGPDETPDPEARPNPEFYTAVLQFANPDRATEAYAPFFQWLQGCKDHLEQQGYVVSQPANIDQGPPYFETGQDLGEVYRFVYETPGEPADGYIEDIGFLQREDRLMIMVRVLYGQDDNVTGEHPFAAMMPAAYDRLSS